jgi:3-deoxy-D-manno-octulosonic-acid transferase
VTREPAPNPFPTAAYLGYVLLHAALAPLLALQGIRRAKRRRYTRGWRERLLGPAATGPIKVAVLSVALGETRTAIRAARELRSVGATVGLFPLEDGCLDLVRKEGDFASGSSPFNSPLSAMGFLRRVRPKEVWFVEWADQTHLLALCRLRGIRTRIVNAYFTESDAQRAARHPWRLALVDRWSVQSEGARDRLAAWGVAPERIAVRGPSIGLTPYSPEEREQLQRKWRELLRLDTGQTLLVAGSTYADEERLLEAAFEIWRKARAGARLLVAPRHLDRAPGMIGPFARRSNGPTDAPIVVLDTLGELREVYTVASVAHVGGSFDHGVGGHTPVEALAAGVPVTHGPCFQQQEAWIERLRAEGLALQATDATTLAEAWERVACGGPRGYRASAERLVAQQSSVFADEWTGKLGP